MQMIMIVLLFGIAAIVIKRAPFQRADLFTTFEFVLFYEVGIIKKMGINETVARGFIHHAHQR